MPLFSLCDKLILKLLDNFVITMVMTKDQQAYYTTVCRILNGGNSPFQEFKDMNVMLETLINSEDIQIMQKCGGEPPYKVRLPKEHWSRDRIEYILKKWRKEREEGKDGPTEYYLGEERYKDKLQVEVIKI